MRSFEIGTRRNRKERSVRAGQSCGVSSTDFWRWQRTSSHDLEAVRKRGLGNVVHFAVDDLGGKGFGIRDPSVFVAVDVDVDHRREHRSDDDGERVPNQQGERVQSHVRIVLVEGVDEWNPHRLIAGTELVRERDAVPDGVEKTRSSPWFCKCN